MYYLNCRFVFIDFDTFKSVNAFKRKTYCQLRLTGHRNIGSSVVSRGADYFKKII